MKHELTSRSYRLRLCLGTAAMLTTGIVFAGAAQLAIRQTPPDQNWDTAHLKRLLDYHVQVSRSVPLMQPSPHQVDMRQLLIGERQVQSDQLQEP